MSSLSRENVKAKSEQRAAEIKKYISENDCLVDGEKITAFYKGKSTQLDVYELPRNLLRLNPKNWRFRAEVQNIRDERQRLGKPDEFDSDNEDDVKAIRDVLKGIKPVKMQMTL